MSKSFIQSQEYQELKSILEEELVNSPIKLKTEGKTNEMIAREITAHELAAKMIKKVISSVERQSNKIEEKNQRFV